MSNVPNINRIITINNLPLIRQYPKPERECKGKRNILYRVHFVYKTRQTGEKFYNLVGSNFVFNTDNPDRKLKAGDLVKYKPKGDKEKSDPNYGQIARITKLMMPKTGEVVLKKESLTKVDINFQNPKEVNNKVINEKKDISIESLELLLKDNDVVSFVCLQSLINKQIIREYELSRNNYKGNKTNVNKRRLINAENNLWNRYFKQDDNNEPMYPIISEIDNIDGIKELNKAIERMVKIGFTPDNSNVKKKIIEKNNKKFARFPVPEGFNPGKNITINIDGYDISVKIPIQIDGKTPGIREIIEIEILQENNNNVYHKLKSSSNRQGKFLEFIPTVILSDYSNFDDGKKMILDKLVKPSKNQKFFIRSAEIVKEGDYNFDFKKLDRFDKDIEKLVLDLEVKVILELDLKDQIPEGAKMTTIGNFGRSIKSAILSGNSLNCRENMRKLKEGTTEFINNVMPAGMKEDRDRRKENKKRDKENIDRIAREQQRIYNNIHGRVRREGVRQSSNLHRGNTGVMRTRINRRRASVPTPSAPPIRDVRVGGKRRRCTKKRLKKKMLCYKGSKKTLKKLKKKNKNLKIKLTKCSKKRLKRWRRKTKKCKKMRRKKKR